MSLTLLVASLVVPLAALMFDLRRRRLTWMRLLRPIIVIAIIVPFVMPGFDFHGTGLAFEAVLTAAGIAVGLLASASMRLEHDPEKGPVTVAGTWYAAIWIVFTLARLVFEWEAEHSTSFQHSLGSFLVSNHMSADSLADGIMFMMLAMMVALRISLIVRMRMTRPAPTPAAVPVG